MPFLRVNHLAPAGSDVVKSAELSAVGSAVVQEVNASHSNDKAFRKVSANNVNANAWGDDERMRQIESRLHRDHWECVPEYKQAMAKEKGSGDSGAGGRATTPAAAAAAAAKPKKEVMKKKSDKNLKALKVIETIGKNSHFSSDERIHLATMFVNNFGAEKHPGLKLFAIDARSFQRIMHATFGITNEKIIEGLKGLSRMN